MPLPLLLIAAAAAGQPASAPSAPAIEHRVGRAFVSPMGEPFYADANGAEGLDLWFSQSDLNHDGSITLDEMTADAQRFFKMLDTNHDGEIDPDEVTHYEVAIAPRSARYSLLNIREPVISADADFNRGVSEQEFSNSAAKRFQQLDVNRTGRLTLSSLDPIRRAAASAAKRPDRKIPYVPLDPQAATESAVPQR